MVDLSVVLEDADLRRRYGSVTLERAWDYYRTGQVLSVVHEVDGEGDLDIRGTVAGSTSVPYSTFVSVGTAERGLWVYSRCSCPVGEACKHALALLIAVRAEQEVTSYAAGNRRWERQLTSVLDELDDRQQPDRQSKPLALQLELTRPGPGRGYRGWSEATTPVRGALRIRPLQRGARDNWVKSGVSWQEVPYLATRRTAAGEQAEVLAEMLASYRAASRQTYFGSETHLTVAGFGPSLWSLLERARACGLVLVPGPGVDSVEVHPGPVALELDVNAPAGTDAHVRLGVRLDGEWYPSDDLDVLGESGHGVALWSPTDRPQEWALTLAPLVKPAGPEVRRLLAAGDTVVPAADRDDLVADFLPRLQRHVPVTSSDGSVRLPEPAVPRLAVTVTWVAVDEVRVAWSWRYRAGDDDRVYALGESRGLRGFRRPDLERGLLDALVLGRRGGAPALRLPPP